jgi:hypothetical protein
MIDQSAFVLGQRQLTTFTLLREVIEVKKIYVYGRWQKCKR